AALDLLSSNGLLPDDFKFGVSSGAMVLYQWANGKYTTQPGSRFRQIAENDYTQWYTKGKLSSESIAAMNKIEIALQSIFQELLKLYEDSYSNYLSACHTKKYLYVLGIVHDIVVHIREYQNEHGTLLLSDTNDLLGKIISYDDTPFVYEKIGTQIDHYFIDEFQDTSLMQWRNFYPLIKESNDRGMTNLLVGDVKQSIYRWRNSDWELLNERIPDFFTKEEWREETLDTNWRSAREVIRFNNTFFEQGAALLQKKFNDGLPPSLAEDDGLCHQIERAYRNAAQKVGKEQVADGYVEIDFLGGEISKEGGEISAKEVALNRTVKALRDLQDRGFSLRDIAILVRSKSEGNMVVQHLLETQAEETEAKYRYDVISDEALYIGNSPTVQLVIAVLDYLNAPQDTLERFFARYWTETLYRGESPNRAIPTLCKLLHTDSPDELLTRMEQLRGQSLYELCEELINLFPMDKSGEENVFIQAFLDLVLQYMDKHSSDLDSFLSWWHEKGATQSLSTPESQDAVRVMTIHKSKGLEFKVVLIPFCNWVIDHQPTHTNILWAETAEPFDALPVVPVAYSKKLADTSYARTYFTEQIHSYIDNLNLAYVAFTRACEELYVFVPMEKKNTKEKKTKDIGSLLQECLAKEGGTGEKEGKPYADLCSGYNSSTEIYALGIRSKNERLDKRKVPDSLRPYGSVLPGERLRLRLMGQDFFSDENRRHYGTVCHAILSRIVTAEDVVPALREHIQAGEISSDEAREIGETLCRQLDEPQKKSWFQADNRVLNEREILQPDRGAYRPDRMVFNGENHVTVIDYKFGRERASYREQVVGYMHLLEGMGYTSEGYIWYVPTGKVVAVTR
ncbi:MAG: UvrD-helicase domain-containing protein, partial [Porphyromonadaceae bacterium]|nr:UvrD-helicase domain-containing protein [Porphyromonadaceae bacterium]